MLDEPSVTAKKIMRAVTDTEGHVRVRPREEAGRLEPAHHLLGPRRPHHRSLEDEYAGRGYGDLKKGLAEVPSSTFGPMRERTLELLDDPAELDRMLAANADRASAVAEVTLAKAYDRVGLLRPAR